MAKDLQRVKNDIIIRMQKIVILIYEIIEIGNSLTKEEKNQVKELINADPRIDDIKTAFEKLEDQPLDIIED